MNENGSTTSQQPGVWMSQAHVFPILFDLPSPAWKGMEVTVYPFMGFFHLRLFITSSRNQDRDESIRLSRGVIDLPVDTILGMSDKNVEMKIFFLNF